MALLYGMFRSWIVVLRKLAARKHDRLKKLYENAETAFRRIERDCKNDEVSVGRPAAYSAQLKLMKRFEAVELSKARWLAAQRKLARRSAAEANVNRFKGRKIPYTFGLFDMAFVIKGVDLVREAGRFDLNYVAELVNSWMQ